MCLDVHSEINHYYKSTTVVQNIELVLNLIVLVVKIKQMQWGVLLEHLLQLGASNVIHAPKELIAQLMDCQHMCCVLMAHTLTCKDRVIVSCVMLALDVQVLEWKLLKCVQMELTVMQLGCVIVFCVQKDTGERNFFSYFSFSVSVIEWLCY